jgi:hypothetical protein
VKKPIFIWIILSSMPGNKERNAEFRIVVGKFKVFAKDLMKFKKRDFQVKTPTAVIGVRGTVYMVWVVDGNITQVVCFEGMLEVANQFDFTDATAVKFGGTAASSFTVDSPTQITAVVGSGSTGKVSVTTPSSTITSTYDFTFYNSPSTLLFSPTAGETGTSVTITGTNFTGATAVKFGGTAASSFTVDSPTQITAVVGSGSTGKVSVTTPSSTITSTYDFTFYNSPSTLSFSPTAGETGTSVTITGTKQYVNLTNGFSTDVIKNLGPSATRSS